MSIDDSRVDPKVQSHPVEVHKLAHLHSQPGIDDSLPLAPDPSPFFYLDVVWLAIELLVLIVCRIGRTAESRALR
jgi:hypothetical protein